MLNHFEGCRQLLFEIEVSQVRLFEFYQQLRELEVIPILFFLLLKCVEMVEAIVRYCLDEIRLCVLDFCMINAEPFHECILYHIFRIRFTTQEVVSNLMQQWLIEYDSLCLIQNRAFIITIKVQLNAQKTDNHRLRITARKAQASEVFWHQFARWPPVSFQIASGVFRDRLARYSSRLPKPLFPALIAGFRFAIDQIPAFP